MAQSTFTSEANRMLADFIWKAIENEPETKNVISSREQIVFSSPKSGGKKGTGRLTIFLYNIVEETEAEKTKSARGQPEKKAGFASLKLQYLVTPFTGNDDEDRGLIEKIIHAVSATSVIAGADGDNGLRLKVKVDSLSVDELSKLWIALNAPLRLSVLLTVSSAEAEHFPATQNTNAPAAARASEDMEQAVQLYREVFKTFVGQVEDWKKRNFVVKQWIQQDFSKNTNMTVNEMQTALKDLGFELERGGSTGEFTKPLTQLTRFYEHQLAEMKGLHRVSHKQSENIEMINAWIKDLKCLTEILNKYPEGAH